MTNSTFASLIIITSLATILNTQTFAQETKPDQKPGEIEIGIVAATSGTQSKEYSFAIRAAELAIEKVNTVGKVEGKAFKLVVEDNKSTAEGAAEAYTKLAARPAVVGILGPIKTAQALAIAPSARKSNIPTMNGSSSSLFTVAENKSLFRVRPTESTHTQVLARYLKKAFPEKKIFILHEDDAFGKGSANYFEKHARDLGLRVLKRATFRSDNRDFKAILAQAKASGAEILLVYSTTWQAIGALLKQHKEMGSPFQIAGNTAMQQKQTLELAKESIEGAIAVADVVAGENEANKKFLADYKTKYKEEPEFTQCWTYDGVGILAEAIRKSGTDKNKIRQAITAIKNYDGMLGSFHFDANGEGLHEASVVKIEGNQPKLLERITLD